MPDDIIFETKKIHHQRRKKTIEPQSDSPETNELDEKLGRIYEEPQESRDMSRFERRKSRGGFWVSCFFLLFLGLAAGAAWFGYFVFYPKEQFSENDITLEITAPDTLTAPATSTLSISIRNDSRRSLASASFNMKLPDGFSVISSDPKASNDANDIWLIGSIDAGKNKTIKITTGYDSDVSGTTTLRAILTYRPSNFNSDFQKIASNEIIIVANAATSSQTTTGTTSTPQLLLNDKNGSSHVTVRPGETLDIIATFTNTNSATTTNAIAEVVCDAPSVQNKSVLDFSDLQTIGDPAIVGSQLSATRRQARITWTSDTVSTLKSIVPMAKIKLPLHLSIKSLSALSDKPKEFSTNCNASLKADSVGFSSDPLSITIVSDTTIYSSVTPSDTGFDVVVKLKNQWHDLENVELKIPLFSSAQVISSNPSSGEIKQTENNTWVWTIAKWPVSTAEHALTLNIAAKKDPTQTALSEPITFDATDANAKEPFHFTAPALTIK